MSQRNVNTSIQSLIKSLEAFSADPMASDVYKKEHCVEGACALYGALSPQVDGMKITLLIRELVHESSNETHGKGVAHAYIDVEGETLDLHGLNAVERFNDAYPESGPDSNGCVDKFYRIEMDMSTEERRIAALQVMRQTCDETGCSLDGEVVNLMQAAIIYGMPASNQVH